MTAIWVTDTEPNERFTLYTCGNVGEVFPHVITALTGTLIGEAIRQAQSDVFVEMGMLRRSEVVGPSVGTGVFGGYLYVNGTTLRLFGVRMPGMSWRDGDAQVMGAVEGVPPHQPNKGDRNLAACGRSSAAAMELSSPWAPAPSSTAAQAPRGNPPNQRGARARKARGSNR